MMKKNCILLFLFLFICIIHGGNPGVGIVTYKKGDVKLIREGFAPRLINIDDNVFKTDVIETNSKSKVRIVFYESALQASVLIKGNQKKSITEFFGEKKKASDFQLAKEIVKIFVETERDENTVAGIKSSTVRTNTENDLSVNDDYRKDNVKDKNIDKVSDRNSDNTNNNIASSTKPVVNSRQRQSKKELPNKSSPHKNICLMQIGEVLNPEIKKTAPSSSKPTVPLEQKKPFEIIYPRGEIYHRFFTVRLFPKQLGKRVVKIIDKDGKEIFSTKSQSDGIYIASKFRGKFNIIVSQVIDGVEIKNSTNFTIAGASKLLSLSEEFKKLETQFSYPEDPTIYLMKGISYVKRKLYSDAILQFCKYLSSQKNSRFGKIQLQNALRKAGLFSFNESNILVLINSIQQ